LGVSVCGYGVPLFFGSGIGWCGGGGYIGVEGLRANGCNGFRLLALAIIMRW